MKATGIVRRIDDLGRVVIPKEIRRTYRIREGDPLEIFVTSGGEIVFKKYSPLGEISSCAGAYAEVLAKAAGVPVIVCDKDHVVAVAGIPKKELLNRRVSPELGERIEMRKPILGGEDGEERIQPVEGSQRYAAAGYPVIADGDTVGYLLALSDKGRVGEFVAELLHIATELLARQIAE